MLDLFFIYIYIYFMRKFKHGERDVLRDNWEIGRVLGRHNSELTWAGGVRNEIKEEI
jgi:hypothetical protein